MNKNKNIINSSICNDLNYLTVCVKNYGIYDYDKYTRTLHILEKSKMKLQCKNYSFFEKMSILIDSFYYDFLKQK